MSSMLIYLYAIIACRHYSTMYARTSLTLFSCCGVHAVPLCVVYKGRTPDKVNYAQWNAAWTPQHENSVSEVRAYIVE
jgi:hypothetical protein